MDDDRLHGFWLSGDKEGYIQSAIKHLRLASGATVTRQVASRWYNLNTIFAETADDVWIHRERNEVWWTRSRDDAGAEMLVDDPQPRAGSGTAPKVYLFQKSSAPWSNKDAKGRSLVWMQLHPKAREFLFTEGTAQQLAPENAEYALALIAGNSLQPWHDRAEWKAKEAKGRKYAGTTFDVRQRTIARMAMQVFGTAAQSGAMSIVTKKDKEVGFINQAQLEAHLSLLLEEQEGRCKLTDIPMLMDDADDQRLRCSVDRIESSGHYTAGNIQLVCQFANFWKRTDTNAEFSRLLDLVLQAART